MNFIKRIAVVAIGVGFLSIGTWKIYQSIADVPFSLSSISQVSFSNSFSNNDFKTVMQKQFSVQEGDNLDANVPIADIQLVNRDKNEAQVEVLMAAKNWERAQKFFESLRFQILQEGNTISIKTNRADGHWNNWETGQAQFRVVVHLPMRFNVSAQTSAGDIRAGNLQGNINLISSAGDVEVENVQGNQINIHTSAGDINTGNLEGHISLDTSAGDVEMGDVKAEGLLKIHSSAGDIQAQNIYADEVDIDSNAGTIQIEHLEGDSKLESNAGNIQVDTASGALNASTNAGDIDVTLAQNTPADLRTNVGGITITVPQDFHADIDLKGSDVTMSDRNQFSGTYTNGLIQGKYDGGGAKVFAHSELGDIRLERK